MTVAELREILNRYDDNEKVVVYDSVKGRCRIAGVYEGYDVDNQNCLVISK